MPLPSLDSETKPELPGLTSSSPAYIASRKKIAALLNGREYVSMALSLLWMLKLVPLLRYKRYTPIIDSWNSLCYPCPRADQAGKSLQEDSGKKRPEKCS